MTFSRSGMKRWLIAAGVAFLASASMASAAGRGLTTTLEARNGFAGAADDVVVRITYQNDSSQDIYLLSWQTPLENVRENIFDVQRDGRPVGYIGRLYKWATPKPSDYLRIPAGESVSSDVELSSVYDMSRTGEYTIRYRVDVREALRSDGLKVGSLRGLQHLESNAVFVGVERNERALDQIETMAQIADAARGGQDKYLTPSYVSCSTTRQSTLVTATSNAQSMSQRARDYLNNLPTASRSTDAAYRTWFGAYTSSRYSTVQSHFNNIYSAFANQRFTYYCDCTDSAYAWVYANQPYRVHLCNAFWSAPMTGTDSKAGTLIHEASHFTVVAGTGDYAYGQTACRNLATSSPSTAVNNADNHEYFAETR